ncbi:hypothetical protein KEH56_09605 [Burkholderia cenocepacia]|uniref:hypothetical protein n=1 Tax=Burkholderia cenocepacia TaxID=95486 RepID=UPI001BA957CF|nr:hypothetical protein [Burkholderia cenocepacia]QUN38495.1 hypothetical protein KEH56_09605 [Burkholderia cenocepacia]QUO29605.1 hypothetical protein KEH57_24370 [Burkholderia cenocepacia]
MKALNALAQDGKGFRVVLEKQNILRGIADEAHAARIIPISFRFQTLSALCIIAGFLISE